MFLFESVEHSFLVLGYECFNVDKVKDKNLGNCVRHLVFIFYLLHKD